MQFGAGKTLKRLDEMLSDAMNGTFEESRYDETELSRLESRWKQYLSTSKMSMEQTMKEREQMKSLVSDISHQTKTPLSNILLYAELLFERTKDGDEKLLAEQILKQTEKLEFLIQALVKMSRLESDVLEVVPKPQSVEPLVKQAVEMISVRAEAKNITVEIKMPEESYQATYDFKWTAEALGNILDNAVKYSPVESHIFVQIREFEFYTCIEVQDQGIGIEESEKAQIFGRFYRGSSVQQEEGIGIGLYLAREIIQKENGYIKVYSKEGKGTTFGVYLPKCS